MIVDTNKCVDQFSLNSPIFLSFFWKRAQVLTVVIGARRMMTAVLLFRKRITSLLLAFSEEKSAKSVEIRKLRDSNGSAKNEGAWVG